MKNLELELEDAIAEWHAINEIQRAILTLSSNVVVTELLMDALHDANTRYETLWQEIEQRADFQAKYGDREEAIDDFFLKS